MIHRPSVYAHAQRAAGISDNLIFHIFSGIPLREQRVLVEFFATHHDDDEIITTDLPSPLKLQMTEMEKAKHAALERKAFAIVGKEYLKLSGEVLERYCLYMRQYQDKLILEAQIVDVADKFDAVGETLHEIRCGNKTFLEVYQYYKDERLELLRHYPFWKTLEDNPSLGLNNLPTVEEAEEIPLLI